MFAFNAKAQDGASSSADNSGEGFNLGLHAGIPVGDIDDFSSFVLGLDVSYLFNVGNGIDVGIATGYINFFSKDFEGVKLDDLGIIPIAASTRVVLGEEWFLGVDLGYAVITNKDADGGGFYYYPKVGLKLGSADIFGYYQGISDDGDNVASVGVGASFNIN